MFVGKEKKVLLCFDVVVDNWRSLAGSGKNLLSIDLCS